MNKGLVLAILFLAATAVFCAAEETAPTETPPDGGFWSEGLVGFCGGRTAWWAWTIGFLVFLGTSAYLTLVVGVLVGVRLTIGPGPATILFMISGGMWYIVYWGFADSILGWIVWIVLLALYLLVGGIAAGGLAAASTDSVIDLGSQLHRQRSH